MRGENPSLWIPHSPFPEAHLNKALLEGGQSCQQTPPKPPCWRGPQESPGTERHVCLFHSPQAAASTPRSCLRAGQTRTEKQQSPRSCAVCFLNSSCFHGVIRSRCWFCLSLSPLSLARCFFLMTDRGKFIFQQPLNQRGTCYSSASQLGASTCTFSGPKAKEFQLKSIENPHRFILRMISWELLGERKPPWAL